MHGVPVLRQAAAHASSGLADHPPIVTLCNMGSRLGGTFQDHSWWLQAHTWGSGLAFTGGEFYDFCQDNLIDVYYSSVAVDGC
jgi:hypothetical protein